MEIVTFPYDISDCFYHLELSRPPSPHSTPETVVNMKIKTQLLFAALKCKNVTYKAVDQIILGSVQISLQITLVSNMWPYNCLYIHFFLFFLYTDFLSNQFESPVRFIAVKLQCRPLVIPLIKCNASCYCLSAG